MGRLLLSRLWSRIGLTGRLGIVMACAMLISVVVLLFTSVVHEKKNQAVELDAQLNDDMNMLLITLPEQVVTGDYATIEMMLNDRLKSLNVERVVFTDSFGKSISASGNPVPSRASRWFVSLIDMPAFSKTEPLVVGGRQYGTIDLQLTATPAINRMWSMFTMNIRALLLALALTMIVTILIVGYGLRPLFALAEGARRIGEGDYSTKIPEQGTADMAMTINAFNHMSDQLKRTIDQLNQSKNRLSVLYNGTPVMLHSIDQMGMLVEVNDYWLKTMGYERSEVIGRKVTDFYTDASRKHALETVQPAFFKNGAVRDVPFQFIKKTGELLDVLLSATGERDADGNIIRSLAVIEDITERKRVQEALQASEGLMNCVVDSSADAIFVKDLQGRYVLMNRAGSILTGRTAEEVLGKDDTALFPPTEAARVMEDDRIVMNSAASVMYEHILTMGGEQRMLQVRKGPVFDKHHNITGVYGISRDITDRKRMEDALRSSEGRYKAIVENQAEFVVRYLPGGVVTFINDTFCSYLKMKREELLGKSYYPFMHEDDRASFICQIESLDFKNPSMVAEARVVLPDGRITWQKWSHSAIFDKDVAIIEYQATGRDITESKLVEEALRSSEARFRTIIENASTGILVADTETRQIRYANPEICRMLGYSEQEFCSLLVTNLPTEAELSESMVGLQEHVEGKVQTSERTIKRKNGSSLRMSINSVRMEIDNRPCLVGFFSDVTEKRLLEEERLKTQKLEAIGTLAGGIAHDFNNLLQGVFGYISLAKLKRDDKVKSLAALEEAEKALHLSVNLTNQLLTFSKGGKPVKKTHNLRPVIENAARFALSGSRSDFRIVADNELWRAEVDEGQIGQVIQNIVLNADQAMPEGGLVEIGARNIHASGTGQLQGMQQESYVEIAIRDNGVGIPGQYLARIFDPYFTTKEKGTGLGLATSYSIIKNHNGLIDVKSEMGRGTTFLIYLPAKAATPHRKQATPLAAAAKERSISVLVMDDEQIIRDIAGELIQALGHKAEFATNGSEAIAKYQLAKQSGNPFDLVILDLTIRGGMGGAEAMSRLLELDPGVNAVVSSGYSDDAVISNFRELGFLGFLKKPYDMEALHEVLSYNLDS